LRDSAAIEVLTLTDGGQTAEAIAERLTGFLSQARRSLDIALYDVRLPGGVGDSVAGALKDAAARVTGALHDYMHAKVTVAGDTVFVGSFNLSRSGEANAENVLEVENAALAARPAAYIDAIRARFPELPPFAGRIAP
jgi:phosphatidylserine/phosphatidylglycerophosphate/cardiolipin synthase-like enzyme